MKHICIIEHHQAVNAQLVRLLSQPGFFVSTFEQAGAALEVILAEPPDIAVVELFLPETDGIEILLALRVHFPDLPVVMLVGQSHALAYSSVNMALKLGANAAIQAPLCGTEVFRIVHRLLYEPPTVIDAANTPETKENPPLPLIFPRLSVGSRHSLHR